MMIKKVRVICIVILLIVSVFGGVFGSVVEEGMEEDSGGIKESLASENGTSYDPYRIDDPSMHGVLHDDLINKLSSTPEDGYVEVIIRLSPKEFQESVKSEVHWGEAMSSLKEHSRREQTGIVELIEGNRGRVLNTFWIANAVLAEVPVGSLNDIARQDNVWSVHENFEVSVQDTKPGTDLPYTDCLGEHVWNPTNGADGELYGNDITWGLERINVTGAWEKGIDGTGVRVAVSDTGVDITHPDLSGKMVNVDDDGYYTGGWIHFDSHGDILADSVPHDTSNHGTHCSGTILGGNHSGTHIGVAPGAELMHALVLPDGSGTFARIVAGMEWKAEPYDRHGNLLEPVEEHRAHVASMSWGASGYQEYLKEPILNLKNSGVVPVAAMGNDGEGSIGSPGSIYESFGIGASDVNDDIADFSSGAIVEDQRDDTPEEYVKPDFSAPGVDVFSAVPGGDWNHFSGTSTAAPHVAGIVALMLDSYTSINDVYEALAETADYYEAGDDLGGTQNTRYGHGIINAGKAVEAVSTIRVMEPTGINRTHATLRAEVFNIPNDEAEVYLRYREDGTSDWINTDPVTVYEPQVIQVEISGLEKGTTYEHGAVLEWDGQQHSTFTNVFRTHRDLEVITMYPDNLLSNSTILRGEVTHLYVEEAEVSFEYRSDGENVWERVVIGNVTEPTEFSLELDDLDPYIYQRYRATAEFEGEGFTGDTVLYMVQPTEPEWCDDEKSYQITDVFDLQWMKNDLGSNYTIVNDIDATASENFFGGVTGFVPVGTYRFLDSSVRFHGRLDGRNHTIDGLYINRPYEEYVGLFGCIERAEVKDARAVNFTVNGGSYVGGLIGYNQGTVQNSYATGSVNGGSRVGGLVGLNAGTVTNSYATGSVSGDSDVGGLVGYNSYSTVENSYATGNVSGNEYVGGLVGVNWGTVSNSNASGSASGNEYVGGLVGGNEYGTVSNSYANGSVSGSYDVGGLVGFNEGTVENSHYDIDSTLINSEHHITLGGLFNEQFMDWLNNDRYLNISDYSDTLVHVNDHYEIGCVDGLRDLLGFADRKGYKFRLVADIDLSGEPGLHIPYLVADINGDNHTISNLIIDIAFSDHVGMFGHVEGGELANIGMLDVDMFGRNNVGGIVGLNEGTVLNSYAIGDVVGNEMVGGLVGLNEGTVLNSYAIGDVVGNEMVGGLVGLNEGSVEKSHYDIDSTLINSEHHITLGGIFNEQFMDWLNNGRHLAIAEYSDTLIPVDDNYEIRTVDGLGDLLGFADREGYKFSLAADLDLSDEAGLYIPYLAADFDGDNHTISNLHIDIPFSDHVGMFGHVDGSEVINIGMLDVDVFGRNRVGGLVGWNYRGNVSNSYVTGDVTGRDYVGVLVGFSERGTVEKSYAAGTVSGELGVGGLMGKNRGTLNNSYAAGTMNGNEYLGGLVGQNSGTVSNSYATGTLSGGDRVGGLVGENWGKVSNSNASGNVTGGYCVGGLVGENWVIVSNSNASGSVTGSWRVGGLVGCNYEYRGGRGEISYSFATGNVSGEFGVGGLVGWNEGAVEKSYVTGDVRGGSLVGGFVGLHFWGYDCPISNCYATGQVYGNDTVGGFVGYNRDTIKYSYSIGGVDGNHSIGGFGGRNEGTISNSFWDIETSGHSTSNGGVGKTTEEMKDVATYTDLGTDGLEEPWDFAGNPNDDKGDEDIWHMDERVKDGYPFLNWEKFALNITSSDGGEVILPGEGLFYYGRDTEAELSANPKEGWHFSHWTGDVPEGEEYSEEITVVMDKDKEITAHFEIKKYTLGVETHGDGSVYIVSEQDHYEHGTEVEIDAHPDEGWYFSHWSGDVPEGEEYNEDITVFMDDDKTLTAHFEMREFSLNIIVEGDGTTVPSIGDHTYIYEDEVNVTASAADGWYFSHWSGDVPEGVEYNENITIFMDDNKTLTAHFDEIIPPTVNITSFDDGEVFDNDEVTVEWEAVEGTYSIDRYELRLNDGEWIDVGTDTRYTFEGLEDGEYNVTVRVVDSEGNYGECSLEFTVERPLLTSNWWFYLIGAVVAVSILLILWQKDYLKQTTLDEEDHEEEDTDS